VNFLSWSAQTGPNQPDAFLLYRNLLPKKSFAGAVTRVPYGQFAEEYIGDYAPRLESMTIAEFNAAFRTGP
jgi:hypothetical protein